MKGFWGRSPQARIKTAICAAMVSAGQQESGFSSELSISAGKGREVKYNEVPDYMGEGFLIKD